MKILVLAPMTEKALTCLRSLMPVTYESWTETRALSDPEVLARRLDAEGFSILVVEADFLPEELFQQASGLRLVVVCRGNLGHVDLAAATQRGVAVVNTPGRNAQAVAELTMGLMLTLARGITKMDTYTREGWWRSPVEPYVSMHMRAGELAGKTLGILGLGNVGSLVAGLARAFDMRVIAYDPNLDPSLTTSPAVPMANTVTELAEQSDYISLHVPDVPGTHKLLSWPVIQAVKPGCRIINTSSYPAVDEEALLEALRSGRVGGAAFDVFNTHPLAPNSPLLHLDNVVLTPHIGGATLETVVRHSQMIVEDISTFVQGGMPKRLVNQEVWDRRD